MLVSSVLGAALAGLAFAVCSVFSLSHRVTTTILGAVAGVIAPMLVDRLINKSPDWLETGFDGEPDEESLPPD